ncbi:apolipoprotein N-acyltransferase [Hyphomicrobium methylovorum]|uniref:apolipoprotein N-acyltransferase n=1 Tax=Hyphomicrobium methylovorum TaxID=84 RepID=UPI001FEC5758|nr:apolipoprotein N-acyltransferase [Hyphomicrobium methylovorum]
MAALRAKVVSSIGWTRAFLAIAAGSLSALAFAPFFASPVLFFTLPVFIWLIDASSGWRQAATSGWLFGFGYFFFSLFWVGEAFLVEADKFAWLIPFAITLLPAGLALYWAAAAATAQRFWPRDQSSGDVARIFVFAISLAAFEWLRGHLFTGFPWNLPGYALTYPLPLMQSAAIFGSYALTAIALVVFAAPLVILGDSRERLSRQTVLRICAFSLLPIGLLFGYGSWRLAEPQAVVPGVKLRIVQPSVPQREKWMPQFQRRIFDDHIALSLQAPDGTKDALAGVTHLIWPEAAMPFFPLESREALDILASVVPSGTTLVTGALRHDPNLVPGQPVPTGTRALNSILAFDEHADVVAIYDKIKLVPFGEYLPIEPMLSAIGLQKLTYGRGSFSAGEVPRPLMSIPGLPPVLGLVCYEVLFPGTAVQGSERPGLIINVTNDGWFGNTIGPYQHFYQARVRAVEEGTPLVRAANNGVSAVIDPYGRVLHELLLNVRGSIDSALPASVSPPIYARAGDWMLVLVLVLFAGFAAGIRRSTR